ncbi:MAG: PBECR4 domain-containing protein [Oscillospiraceae bacterium]|nr:PBECR4 domain-containing protein [Oscillospiraceae bacterium]
MQYSKKDAIDTVINCAEKYRDELNNRNLLFVCMDKHKRISYVEVTFHDYSYMHMTGLRPAKRLKAICRRFLPQNSMKGVWHTDIQKENKRRKVF